jgi:hypothetical protein
VRLRSGDGDLKYVYQRGLVAFPTMAVVLASPGNWLESEASNADYRKVLHGLPPSGRDVGRSRVFDLLDKGKDKGG